MKVVERSLRRWSRKQPNNESRMICRGFCHTSRRPLKTLIGRCQKADLVAAGVEANVRWSLKQLQRVAELRDKIEEGSLKIGGSVYELKTGQVRMME